MKIIAPVMCILITLMAAMSCAEIRRESRFVSEVWPKDQGDLSRDYYISNLPLVKLSSPCRDEASAFLGPFIFIPLPVLPNPLWPFRYFGNKWKMADLILTIEAPPHTINWDMVTIALFLNGRLLASSETVDHSSTWKDKRRYSYQPARTCGELEDSEITVHIDGVPGTIDSAVFYTYRWTVHVDGR